MIPSPHESHQHEKDNHHRIGVRQTDKETGYSHTANPQCDYDPGADAISEPPRRELSDTVGKREDRNDHPGLRVIKVEIIADQGRQRDRKCRQKMVAEVRQYEKGDYPQKRLVSLTMHVSILSVSLRHSFRDHTRQPVNQRSSGKLPLPVPDKEQS
jgi:hypothetical protein